MYHHKRIKRFGVKGVIHDDSAIPRFRYEYTRILSESMREQGYVVRIDIPSDFTICYTGKAYEFGLSVYGVYVGKKKAQCIKYLDGSQPLMMNQLSPQSLQPQE